MPTDIVPRTDWLEEGALVSSVRTKPLTSYEQWRFETTPEAIPEATPEVTPIHAI